ncbi:ATP-binding protein [Methanolobus sp. WCC5]|uniref:ATP-binding protein n=1 Tax=Methanolobus sp. WCC5 TaxID=3125785 RepID=UPI003251C0E2
MDTEILISLINNAALLLAIGVLYDVLFFNMEMNTRLKSIILGFFVGLIGIALMLNPWELAPGLFYDTRSILLSIVGLFFGPCPAIIGALIIISYRLYLGGIGAIVGVSVTIGSVLLGLSWRRYQDRLKQLFGIFDLYVLGILVHLFMLLCMLLLPWPYSLEVLSQITLPVMLIYPAGTVLLGRLLNNQLARKRTQEALKENEIKLQSFIDNVPVGMFRKNSKGRMILANPEMARIVGQETPEQAVNSLQDIGEQLYVDPDRRKELINILKTEEHIENFEYEALRADGKHIWLLVNAKISGDIKDDSFEIDGFALDITNRKKIESDLKQAEWKYRQAYYLTQGILESPKDVAIFALDMEYRYLAFNKNHRLMMEQIWDAKIEPGSHMLSYLNDPVDREKAKLNFDRALAGEAFTLVEEYGEKLHERRWYENAYSPLKDDEGIVIGLTLFLADITERKEAEKALIHARILAEESSRIKSEFIANMSHELRTPLNSVIGFSEIMLDGLTGELDPSQRNYIQNISKSGKHLLEIINDILDISKIESGNMDYNPEKINLREVIAEVATLTEPLAKKKSIDFRSGIGVESIELYADRIKIKQILYNLITNAVKFTDENGKICIDTRKFDGNISISVSDTGIGIPENEQKAIFEPFKQVNSSSNRIHGGTGLGLSIVKHYVQMHSGEIRVKSEPGKGSTFTFTIPVNHSA